MSTGYEFTKEQNDLIGNMAGKMTVVGLVNVVIGVLYLLTGVLLLAFIFQDRIPAEVTAKIPAEVQDQIPASDYLWGMVIQLGVAGLIFLMIGIWTRAAAASFREIVATTGRDISHLMNALGSLNKMYTLIYTLIVITLLASVIGLALQLYLRYGQ